MKLPLFFDDVDVIENHSTLKVNHCLHVANMEYNHRNFTLGGDFIFIDYDSKQNLVDEGTNINKQLLSDNIQKVKKGSLYLNNNHKIGEGTLSYGLDISYFVSNSTFSEEWTRSLDKHTSHSKQTEDGVEVLAKWSQKLGTKVTLSAGLMGQYYYVHMKNTSDSYRVTRKTLC